MSIRKVPALSLQDSLSQDPVKKEQFAKDLYNSFKEYGFVVIKDHTIPVDLMARLFKAQADFFALPEAIKNKYDMNISGQRGYTKFGTEHAKGSAYKDLKEFYHVGREQYLPNTWPQEVPEFKPAVEEMIIHLDKVGDVILSALGTQLGCGPDFLPATVKDGASVLRLLHYPPVTRDVIPGEVRAAAHSDICSATILISPPGMQKGLELLDTDGNWLPVDSDSGTLVVNLGDMISRMTNYNLPSTIHRVVLPEGNNNVSRYSCPFFIHPRAEVVLDLLPKYKNETPKDPIVTADEFLTERLREIGLKK
jgi:isopenicillin N synthase-like dioxygenase